MSKNSSIKIENIFYTTSIGKLNHRVIPSMKKECFSWMKLQLLSN